MDEDGHSLDIRLYNALEIISKSTHYGNLGIEKKVPKGKKIYYLLVDPKISRGEEKG